MNMNLMSLLKCCAVLTGLVLLTGGSVVAKPAAKVEKLSPEGERLAEAYSSRLEALRAELTPLLPAIDEQQIAALNAIRDKPKSTELAEVDAAKPILSNVDAFLASDALDAKLVTCAVLADATPRGLAAFAEQGPEKKKLIDDLLADTALMQQMLYAGGAKAGRYGRAMEIYRDIQAASERARDGHFQRLALATALELAAPDLTRLDDVDPMTRYQFFEQSYLDKQLDPHFDTHTTWLYRHVINDPHSEDDMRWMRQMLWNYRPDFITVPDAFQSRYVGLMNSEFGHKKPEFDETLPTTVLQQSIDRGGLCGPKAFFGRCLGRSFGVPVWGARLKSHTAMMYWTPKGWTQILGVSWQNAFWIADPEKMRAWYFRIGAMAREYPDSYIKVCRAQWAGNVLGETKVDGMEPQASAGIWNVLALNEARAIVLEHHPVEAKSKMPWLTDTYTKQDPKRPEDMMTPAIEPGDKKISVDDRGVITIPAAACVAPAGNTEKVVFARDREGRMILHYKRWGQPEAVAYDIDVAAAGKYALTADVVTVNRDQFFLATVNGASAPVEFKMPYTVGQWGTSEPLVVTLNKGKNTLSFTRTVPDDFEKEGYRYAGPQFGGVTIAALTLTPVK